MPFQIHNLFENFALVLIRIPQYLSQFKLKTIFLYVLVHYITTKTMIDNLNLLCGTMEEDSQL